MKLWLSKNSEVPIREQLTTQISLGIISGDLEFGEKLPSTRELARRFKIHSNTISHAYQKLSEDGWIEFKQGSGFYVCEVAPKDFEGETGLDGLIAEFFKKANEQGFSKKEIKSRLQKWFSAQPPEHLLVIETNENLREILIEEISRTTSFEVVGTSVEEFEKKHKNANAICVAMSNEEPKLQGILPDGKTCIYLKARSVSGSMTGEERPSAEDLIAIVSGWDKFLVLAKTVLVAAEIESDSLLIRSTNEKNWKKGLNNAAMIICDALTANHFSDDKRTRPFHLIGDDSLQELKEIVGEREI